MHTKILFSLFVFVLIICPQLGYSKCLTDIYSVGLSLDSFVYELKETKDDYATLSSKNAYGFKASWIQYCPTKKIEFTEYLRMRHIEFDVTDQIFNGFKKGKELLSLGFETRYFYSKKVEFIGDVEVREDISFYYDNGGSTLYPGTFLNLKTSLGTRYFLKSNKTEDYALSGKLGYLLPIENTKHANSGSVFEIDFEYFKRMTKKYSLKLDIYFSSYNQKIDDVDFERLELGFRGNYVFRY